MKATARAYSVQGLTKHLELLDPQLRLPFHDSISVCTAPLSTVTTFAFQEDKECIINQEIPNSYWLSRIDAVVSEIKRLSGVEEQYKIVSKTNFSDKGFRALSSEFAALSAAASEAAQLDLSHKELSRIAGKGTGSASRSVTGYFSRWRANMDEKFCYSFVLDDDLEMGMVAALVEPLKESGESRFHIGLKEPYLEYWLKSVHTVLYEMERAIKDHDISKIGQLAEKESILLYAFTMDSDKIMWRPDTFRVIAEVRSLREEGVPAYFNIDTGAVVYINSFPEDVALIEERIKAIGVNTISLSVGGEAHSIRDHLF